MPNHETQPARDVNNRPQMLYFLLGQLLEQNTRLRELTISTFKEWVSNQGYEDYVEDYLALNRVFNSFCRVGLLEKTTRRDTDRNAIYIVTLALEEDTAAAEESGLGLLHRAVMLAQLQHADHNLPRDIRSRMYDDLMGDAGTMGTRFMKELGAVIINYDTTISTLNETTLAVMQSVNASINAPGVSSLFEQYPVEFTFAAEFRQRPLMLFVADVQIRGGKMLILGVDNVENLYWIPLQTVSSARVMTTQPRFSEAYQTHARFVRDDILLNKQLFEPEYLRAYTLSDLANIVDIHLTFEASLFNTVILNELPVEADVDPVRCRISFSHPNTASLQRWIRQFGDQVSVSMSSAA
jgi:hypothetical protein